MSKIFNEENAVYNYEYEVLEDVKQYVKDNWSKDYIESMLKNDCIVEILDTLATEDEITGNQTGSYFCSTWKAEECLNHNWDEILEVSEDSGIEPSISLNYFHGPEWWDVVIRVHKVYALSAKIEDFLKNIIK